MNPSSSASEQAAVRPQVGQRSSLEVPIDPCEPDMGAPQHRKGPLEAAPLTDEENRGTEKAGRSPVASGYGHAVPGLPRADRPRRRLVAPDVDLLPLGLLGLGQGQL